MTRNDDRLDVLFIGGASRSGSTLLGRVLGRAPGLVHIGELTYLWERGPRENQLCGCGQPFRDCRFWREVLTEAFGSPTLEASELERILWLRQRLDYLPRSPLLAFSPRAGREVGEYTDVLRRMITAIRGVSGADVIVDSSKRPSHGILLNRIEEARVTWLHLVRDSRAVCHSTQRRRRRPEVHWKVELMPVATPWKQALRWSVHNALTELAGTRSERLVRLRYEDFAARPLEAANDVLGGLGLPQVAGEIARELPTGGSAIALATEHTVSGNPMRFETGDVKVDVDTEWETAMNARDRRIVTALSGPFLKRYGYV
jgi:hypothetical protein